MPKYILCFLLVCSITATEEKTLSFPDSVTFNKSYPKVDADKLKGKAVILIFFQSWCPKCNKWADELFKNMQNAWGKRKDIVLVGLKTDGGSAVDYFKMHGGEANLWLIGEDKGAAYQKEINGKKELYTYVLFDKEGKMLEKGFAGELVKDEKGQRFKLADVSIATKLGVPETGNEYKLDRKNWPLLKYLRFASAEETLKAARILPDTPQKQNVLAELAQGKYEEITKLVEGLKKKIPDRLKAEDFFLMRDIAALKQFKEAEQIFTNLKDKEPWKNELAAEAAYLEVFREESEGGGVKNRLSYGKKMRFQNPELKRQNFESTTNRQRRCVAGEG